MARPLSPRQNQVARLLIHGLSDKQIASLLNLSLPAEKSHVQEIFNKLGVRNRSAVAVVMLKC
jgi:LuxR family transcriptional regulator, maltose regulon positive regulatory protein